MRRLRHQPLELLIIRFGGGRRLPDRNADKLYVRLRRRTGLFNAFEIVCGGDEFLHVAAGFSRKILLERAGYQVLTAADGFSGLELFATQPVNAVVLDYSMPGMHGGEVAKKMRQTKPEIPILLLSAYVELPSEVTSLVDVYMTKGEGAPALLEKLDNLLSVPASQSV